MGTRSSTRVIVMVCLGIGAGALAAIFGAWRYALLIGWDVAALFFAVLTWVDVIHLSPSETARRAKQEDPSIGTTDTLLIAASIASLVAVGVVLVAASSGHGAERGLLAGLAAASVMVSWLLVHTLFTLRYARVFYANGGGISFNQDVEPSYLDFAYVSFTIGMTFQVSDTDLKSPMIRATALRHALLSYLFGAVVLATTVNFIVSLSAGSR
jgi:uncharacterized membrane protein